ncbi:YetF domain-containing protein [Algiphilus sp.]|uniref:DUF421 domain-containing protein n=1 Tax=Algiphilus sp. TaxID=1872431 RepID=UPI001CA70108|nr:YetF domain-containing protein [Algiphilus sp.]MBY8965384.1 DUF421 domain-containing protein [Algiphilus acroporae]MCI5063340.1 DUF421 domain-containing protein [Algiphilus sp.]MCI5102872.1 DUF421 domain-containing protein [Algiphilus sp.]MCR9090603.1 DUF421 domain-containing protein [Pseudomonadota bacterium]
MSNLELPLLIDLIGRTFLMMFAIILASRLFGLRSFSQMSGFDFPVAVALGSVLASAVTAPDQPVWVPILAVAALFSWQMIVAPLRQRFRKLERVVDNLPLLVMEDGKVLDDNLRIGGMTRFDLWAKLREANVARIDDVKIAVIEAAGEFTVVYGADEVSPELLEDVRR